MQPGVSSNTQSLSATGTTNPVRVYPPSYIGPSGAPVYGVRAVTPGILINVSAGAALTYSIEVTGDDLDAPTYVASSGNWVPFTGLVGLSASAAATLGAAVTAIRLHVTAYTSGTATFQFVQFG